MAENTKHKHLKHQKEATVGERIIYITHVINKYSGISALQTVGMMHTRVHQKMLGVHHYERVHKGASQAYQQYTQNLKKNYCIQKWTKIRQTNWRQ